MTKLLTSERMWNDMTIVIRSIFPALILLRLADKKKPSMDKLFFYCRKMEESLKRSKLLLDPLEQNYKKNYESENLSKGMLRYFFNSTSNEDINYGTEFMTSQVYIDDDSESDDEEPLDMDTNEDDDESNVVNEVTLGGKVIDLWNHRKTNLESDLAIGGWMVSPHSEIMDDVAIHNGKHRDVTERMLIKWMEHEVNKFLFLVVDINLTLT